MPVYHLPAKQAVADAIAAGLPVPERLIDVATNDGYVIGAGGIQVYPDGSVTIDADRDPAADWAVFDPALPTEDETADRQLRQQVREALVDLDQSADLLLGPGSVTATTQRLILGRLCRIVAALIRVLIRRGVLGEGA